jgi:hypothetical protein
MSLRFFHILFIVISTLMCLVVAMWAFGAYSSDGTAASLGLGILAVAGGALLVVYGDRFLKKTRNLGVAAVVAAGTFGLPSEALACAVCIGNTDSLLRDGMNAGILALLGFTLFMIVSFAAFFVYLWRKAKKVDSSPEGEPAHA